MYNRNNNRGGRDVCKFFLEGRCRFGDGCKNEHPSSGGGGPSNGNRFAPLKNPSNNNARGRSGAVGGNGDQGQTYGITADNIRLDLTDASQKGERPQWEFSAYAPGVGAPRQLLEGQVEQSEEEMRVMCYLANATGQLQAYDQHVNGLRNEVTQQIQRILNDTEGAKRYVLDGQHEHLNRIDHVVKSNRDFPWETKPSLLPQQSTTFGQANSTTTGFGQAKPVASGFGQASGLGGASPFGQPSALGGGGANAFGRPSSMGAAKPAFGQSTFGQPTQPAASVFGQPSQPSGGFVQASQQPAASPFGQTQQPATNAFGQPSQPAANAFGQPTPATSNQFGVQTQQPAANSFGQASQPASNPFGRFSQPAASAFGQPSGPAVNAFGQASTPAPASNPFGQASKPAANPFGLPTQTAAPAFGKPSPFGGAAPAPAAQPAFGSNPFGQQPAQPAFGQASQPTPTFGQSTQPAPAFGTASAPGQGAMPGTQAPAAGPAFSGTNRMLQGQRLYKGKDDQPMIKVQKDGVERETRVWFPNGAPTASAPDTEGPPGAYEGEQGVLLKACYEHVRATGDFPNGIMPECPPKREWVSFDI